MRDLRLFIINGSSRSGGNPCFRTRRTRRHGRANAPELHDASNQCALCENGRDAAAAQNLLPSRHSNDIGFHVQS